jgi:hypothetical protein
MLAQGFIPYPSETQYIGRIRANYLALFPKLLGQSQFNRRGRALRLLVEQLRRRLRQNQKKRKKNFHYFTNSKAYLRKKKGFWLSD